MAKRRPPANIPAFDDELSQSELDYNDFLEEHGESDVAVTIHRFPKVGKDMEWCGTTTIDNAQLELLRDTYGPGKYKLTFRAGGNRGMLGNKIVVIAPPYNSNGNAALVQPPARNDVHLELMREQAQQQQTMLMALITNMKPQPPMDIAPLIQALRPLPGPDPVAMFTALATLTKGGGLKEALEIIEAAKNIGSNDSNTESVLGVVKEVGGKVVDLFSQRRAAPMQPESYTPSTLPAPQNRPALEPAKESDDPMKQWISKQIAFLKEKAKLNKDPLDWVDYILDNQEEPNCQAILRALEAGATFEDLLQFDAEIASNPLLNDWFQKLYDGLQSELSEPLDSTGSGGDSGDALPDAATSKGTESPSDASKPKSSKRPRH